MNKNNKRKYAIQPVNHFLPIYPIIYLLSINYLY